MIANAIGRCEFKTYRNNQEIQESEYYLWNIEPNVNQNSTVFLHKLVAKLYEENESLIIGSKRQDGTETLVIADGWQSPENYPSKPNEYRGVEVGKVSYSKTFYEEEVLHLKLNHVNIKPILDGLYLSYWRLINAAIKNYEWNRGQHWKLHVSDMAQGTEQFSEKFAKMIEEQIKPFLNSNGAILPEFDGYAYENVSGGSGNALTDTRDIKAMIEDIFDFTARGFLIPAVLVNGSIEGTADANKRFLTNCVDPICDQLQEEIIRKRYGYDEWKRGNFLRVDSSSIIHFDIFESAPNVEKLVGSGAYTINDVRKASNQTTIQEPWANEHFMTLNIAPMTEAARSIATAEGGEKE